MDLLIDAETLSSLIGQIYDCAVDASRWTPTMTALRTALGFHNASMTVQALPQGTILINANSGVEPRWLGRELEYGPDVVAQWGGLEKLLSYPLGEPQVLSWVNDRANWKHNRFYVEWSAPQGIEDVLGIALTRSPGLFGSLGLGRHISAGPITQREVDAARQLVPHLQRAVAIGMLLDLQSAVAHEFKSTLDALATAVILVDVDLRIVHANAAATAMLSANDPIGSKDGRLVARPAGAIELAVRATADESQLGRQGFGIPVPRSDGTPMVLHVLPLQRGVIRPGLAQPAAAAIFVASSADPVLPPVEALAALFDLTAAEARVFAHIAAGTSPGQAAARLGIGAGTVKSHLLQIFAKTGTHRQAEVVNLAATLRMPF
jgi:DNA-binding CsgD family transcriptional regulator